MQFKIIPPDSWTASKESKKSICVFNEVFSQYKNKDILFKVIKKDDKNKSPPTLGTSPS